MRWASPPQPQPISSTRCPGFEPEVGEHAVLPWRSARPRGSGRPRGHRVRRNRSCRVSSQVLEGSRCRGRNARRCCACCPLACLARHQWMSLLRSMDRRPSRRCFASIVSLRTNSSTTLAMSGLEQSPSMKDSANPMSPRVIGPPDGAPTMDLELRRRDPDRRSGEATPRSPSGSLIVMPPADEMGEDLLQELNLQGARAPAACAGPANGLAAFSTRDIRPLDA